MCLFLFTKVRKFLFAQSTRTGESDLLTFTPDNFDENVQLMALGRTKNYSLIIDRLQGKAVKDRKSVGSRVKDVARLCKSRGKEKFRH